MGCPCHFYIAPEYADRESCEPRLGEGTFSGDFPKAGINALNSVGRIHHAAYSTAIMEKLFHVHPISLPYAHGSRGMLPSLLESAKFGNSSLEVDGTIDFLKLDGIFFVILGRDVLNGVADSSNCPRFACTNCRNLLTTFAA